MTDVLVEIPRIKSESHRNFKVDTGFREVVADYLTARWRTNTAKMAAREFDLTLDRAREAVAGRVSLSTLEQIFKRGGFPVALPIVAAVIGQSLARHLREMRANHEANGRRLAALFGSDPGADHPDPDGVGGLHRLAADRDDAPRRRVG